MITPDKLTDPKNCLIYYGYLVIKNLRINNNLKYTTLENNISREVLDFSQKIFIESLNFLYMLGYINYNEENDTMECCNEIK